MLHEIDMLFIIQQNLFLVYHNIRYIHLSTAYFTLYSTPSVS